MGLSRSERYRAEAREARREAAGSKNQEAILALLQIAEQYERLAAWAERDERRGDD